jgi:hypothetical protein
MEVSKESKPRVCTPILTDWNHLDYLTQEEADEIQKQFESPPFSPSSQVMWTGMPREWAQLWADQNNVKTLTSIMGPLMDTSHPSCRKSRKSRQQWRKYVKGASGLFAKYVCRGSSVVVLTRPPPNNV